MPKLLPIKIKEEMIKGINSGTSINKISKGLNLGKSTIYYHYKKIKGKRYKEPQFISNLSKEEGEILGIIIGDGSLFYRKNNWNYCIKIRFGKINKEYSIYVKKILERFFKKKFYLYEDCKDKLSLITTDKKIYNHLMNFIDFNKGRKYSTVKVKNLKKLPNSFKKGLIKGLIDTDGSVCQGKDGRIRIGFYTTSKKLSKQFVELLKQFNFKYGYYITKPKSHYMQRKEYKSNILYSTYIWKESIVHFIKLIKPYKSNKIKGLW